VPARSVGTDAPAPVPSFRPPSTTIRVAAQNPLLSVLIPTIFGREPKLARLLLVLEPQVRARADVELLTMLDAKTITIGCKRNLMLRAAKGEYVAFVDDDDLVATDYISSIVEGLVTKPDVLNFMVRVEGYGPAKPCRYSLRFVDVNLAHEYQRRPNHVMVWRRSIAASVPFPDVRRGEDSAWAEAVVSRATTEVSIDRTLYTYLYDHRDNSAQARRSRR
jgi:hypothetical protein